MNKRDDIARLITSCRRACTSSSRFWCRDPMSVLSAYMNITPRISSDRSVLDESCYILRLTCSYNNRSRSLCPGGHCIKTRGHGCRGDSKMFFLSFILITTRGLLLTRSLVLAKCGGGDPRGSGIDLRISEVDNFHTLRVLRSFYYCYAIRDPFRVFRF
jgi:hypothetical protein